MFQSDLTRGDTIASEELLQSIREKEKTIVIAIPGSDEARLLDYFGANASINTNDVNHIIVKPDVRKIEILEEFLHGTQQKLGIIDRLGNYSSEIHVKDFMIRHQKILGLSHNDIAALIIMKNSYIKGLE
jgi:late competence protein required for DNA uptake (superfamily II DNA/RNA helicase)